MNTKKISYTGYLFLAMIVISCLASCEKDLANKTYGTFSGDNFFKTAADAKAAVSAMYTGTMEGGNGGWASADPSFRAQASQTTDEMICNWADPLWARLNTLNFTPDFYDNTHHYTQLMPMISEITVYISKVNTIAMEASLKNRYIAELKALRAYYSQVLYLYYGPVPIRLDAAQVNNLSSPVLPRPTKDEMVNNIINDFTDAISVLPNAFTGADYGRFSKAACYTSLLKLYMQEKRWADAVATGEKIKTLGFSLTPKYADNFNISNKGGNSELILAIVCSPTSNVNYNDWLNHALPPDYVDTTGIPTDSWGGYRMPWKTYDKFDQHDKRLGVLLQKYPVGFNANGTVKFRDARAGGDIGAVPVKFGLDPSKTNSDASSVDYPVFRYADVELLLAEALNEQNGGPNQEAYDLINDVRTTHGGLPAYVSGTLNHDQFLAKIQNERLFELWGEGVRRDDLIRWGLYIKRAKDDGSTFADDNKILYPLPRNVVNQSNGIIKQNPGYN
ncbi:Starch-binding associating with outer membrane [Mucilaginibacter pineti]|uniref:Starch-binding associating with outer membrane n=1 Tax=Mucilaginibacter pineti TaxID=1391627 RepID=A0A1G7CYB0_9SPHI|nr:RagB/SusD family nutrient uptake outer membrane protein [Mucilaginibacter pineti]SDE44269.1 Starch-binding associating with outer membrane [Mucilaginibacter pineti]